MPYDTLDKVFSFGGGRSNAEFGYHGSNSLFDLTENTRSNMK